MLIMPIHPDDALDAQNRADPRAWGLRRKMGYTSSQESDCIFIKVTPEIRAQLTGLDRLANYICITKGGRFEWLREQLTEMGTLPAL